MFFSVFFFFLVLRYLSKKILLQFMSEYPAYLGFPCGSTGKESTHNAGDLSLIPVLGRSLGEGKGYPPQYSGLENPTYVLRILWLQALHFSL